MTTGVHDTEADVVTVLLLYVPEDDGEGMIDPEVGMDGTPVLPTNTEVLDGIVTDGDVEAGMEIGTLLVLVLVLWAVVVEGAALQETVLTGTMTRVR